MVRYDISAGKHFFVLQFLKKRRFGKVYYLMLSLRDSSGSQLSELYLLPRKRSSLANHSFVQLLFGLTPSRLIN